MRAAHAAIQPGADILKGGRHRLHPEFGKARLDGFPFGRREALALGIYQIFDFGGAHTWDGFGAAPAPWACPAAASGPPAGTTPGRVFWATRRRTARAGQYHPALITLDQAQPGHPQGGIDHAKGGKRHVSGLRSLRP